MIVQRMLRRCFSTSSAVWKESSAGLNISLDDVPKSQSGALLSEHCILVDEKDHMTGSATKLDCHKWDPLLRTCPLHRAFSLFLFNTKGELLLQQRSDQKVTFPGHYTNSCCSHPLMVKGEMEGHVGVVEAARRRLHFELGVPPEQASPEEYHYLTRILYSGHVPSSLFAEHEVDYILFLQKDVSVTPNPDEVKHAEYVSRRHIHDYLASLQHQGVPLTPWFELILKHFLPRWWDRLDRLHECEDHNNIHRLLLDHDVMEE